MKKYTVTSVFGIIGIISWAITILLRETYLVNIDIINFKLGVMPNISAAWFFIWMVEIIYEKIKKDFTFKISIKVSGIIFLMAVLSEVVHDMFLNSPFDIFDIMATILAIALYLIVLYVFERNKNLKHQF
ncbi:hypothetical protein EAI30_05395 [Romboutsia ilealis]|uniref:Trypsin n=1 Tax=Romboutsia faecis TaxID=2764597 RepID=A0ABR7JNM8_9FIRM|nr:hypothetical protein [Romboutsia faecis]MBC5996522.1 hypothetical protein [Romboutsia faecis]MRN24048.1 hypothetical protein [Romboutsia ilealis]